ncbi:hypothetical protein Q5M85_02665 [Paraclostridium bifermentans]|nr:hypothetical protein [Paraclostridium bifermentans]
MSNANEKAQVPEIYNVPEKEKIIIDGKVMPGKSKDFLQNLVKRDRKYSSRRWTKG